MTIFRIFVDTSRGRIARGRVKRYDLRAMSLNAQQKEALSVQLVALLDCDEPSAFLATLHRIAERQASHEARRDHFEQALSWQDIADAVAHLRAKLYRSQLSSKRPKTRA